MSVDQNISHNYVPNKNSCMIIPKTFLEQDRKMESIS